MFIIKKIDWIYKLELDQNYNLPYDKKLACEYYFYDLDNNLRVKVWKNGSVTIYKGYAWDGCTPKYKIGSYTFGIWDGIKSSTDLPVTYYASLLHDALYQFYDLKVPFTRKEIDKLFLEFIPKGFKARYIYYIFVRLFGRFAMYLRRKKGNNKGRLFTHV